MPRLDQGTEKMSNQRFASVWDAVEDTAEHAENMKLISTLMIALKQHLTRTDLSQAEAAKTFGVTQPRVLDLMRGKLNLFGLDALLNMAAAAGLKVELTVLEAG
jgi:predicted XRE-type DNA-binding protein